MNGQNPNYAMNPFAGMTSGDQSAGTRYPFLGGDKDDPFDGDYKLVIHTTAVRGRNKPFYVIEVEVVESNQPRRPVGMRCSCFIDLTNVDLRGRNISGFISAVYGVDPTTLVKDSTTTPWDGKEWGDYANWSVGGTNPFAGMKVGCRVQTIETKAGNDFSAHNWVPYAQMVVPERTFVQQPPRQAVPQQPQQPPQGGFAPPGGAAPGAPVPPLPAQQGGFGQPGGQWNGGAWGGPQGGQQGGGQPR
jgi:hypothetical protein